MVAVLAILGREVGPARLGVVAVALALGAVLAGVLDFGANSYWLRELAAGRLTGSQFRRRSGTKLALGLVVSTVLVAGAVVVGPATRPYWGAGVVLLSVLWTQTLQVAVKAREHNTLLAAAVFAERLALGAAFFLMRAVLVPETAFYLSYLIGGLVSVVLCWRAVPRGVRPTLRGPDLRTAWSGTHSFGAATLLTTGQALDTVVAAAVGGPAVAGTYGAVNRWTQPIALATNSFSVLLAAVVAKAQGTADAWDRVRHSLWLPGLSVLAALAMALLAEPRVRAGMGGEVAASAPGQPVLCAGAALNPASAPLLVGLQARGREKLVATALAVAVSLQLLAVAPLVAAYGAMGIAVAALLAQVVVLGAFLPAVLGPLRRILVQRRTER